MYKILVLNFILLLSIAAQCKEAPTLKGRGILFFATSNMWDYGNVNIDGEPMGRIINGFSSIVLEPGVHHLSGFSSVSGNRYSTNTKTANLSIVFEIKPETITSLGTLVFINDGAKNYFFKLKNDRAVHSYFKMYKHDLYKNISKEIFYPDEEYANSEIESIRSYILNKELVFKKDKDFIASELGILVDRRGGSRKINTQILEKINTISAADVNYEKRYFLTSLGELFSESNGSFLPVNQPEAFDVRNGFQAKNWIALENYSGDLSFSKDSGATWEYIDTSISKEFTRTIIQQVKSSLVFGPITGTSDNEYDKRQGYLIDIETGSMKKIDWNKYVFEDSRFYWVAEKLIMDPVRLGGKAFLFFYDNKKDKWREIKLPNRHCKIEPDSKKIKLNCFKGDSYYSDDVGGTWKKL